MSIKIFSVTALAVLFMVNFCKTEDLQLGTSLNNLLAYTEHVQLYSIPFSTRSKSVFYSDTQNRLIKGISAIELDKTSAKASVTAGGVGSNFVNIRLKSQKGKGLNYNVQIYV